MFARPSFLSLMLAVLVGCASDWKIVDGDGDGISPTEGDCWDGAEGPPGSGLSGADIYPGAPDAPYDGFDADCAGNDDYDLDGDGYVTEASFVGLETYAVLGTGTATLSGDCWDNPDLIPEGFTALDGFEQPAAAEVNPDAADAWYDAVDSNCAGDDDFDADGDGYASSFYPDGSGAVGEDCFDDEGDDFFGGDFSPGEINPDAAEVCGDEVDNDCDDLTDGDDDDAEAVYWYPDADEDSFGDIDAKEWDGAAKDAPVGFAIRVCDDPSTNNGGAFVVDSTDCDDTVGTTYPDAPEYCDEVDNDCNGVLDDDDAEDATTWYADTDSDGFGDPDSSTVTCYQPSGYSVVGSDCDDSEALVCPGCATSDSFTDCMADLDSDGFGDVSPDAGVSAGTDCDDSDSSINPGESEIVGDEIDQDCSGGETCYVDADDDGYINSALDTVGSSDDDCTDAGEATSSEPTGDCDDDSSTTFPGAAPNDSTSACMKDDDGDDYGDDSAPAGVTDGDDCDDNDGAISPAATEIAGDEIDQDCDTDEICYTDEDDDGYRPNASSTTDSADIDCTDAGEAVDSDPTGDCDDSDPTSNPGETETVGNEVDNDCSGGETCYTDADNDNYRPNATSITASTDDDCQDDGEATSDQPTTDCDDTDASINPGETETVGNEVDNDCSGGETCYLDDDNDGYINSDLDTVESSDDDCTDSNEATSSEPTGDCDDDSSTTFPGAAPNDSASACMKDDDGDDYGDDSAPAGVTDGDDCDDDDSAISPAGTEITGDEIDQDCNGGEICYLDDDNDGYRPDATSTKTSTDEDCSDNDEATSSEPTGDCDDSNSSINPGETETVGDGVDYNCDGSEICYLDDDNDGYRPDATSTKTSTDEDCNDNDEALSSEPTGDCDDSDSSINPGETETIGDGIDQDCSGGETCYLDDDNDGYINSDLDTVESSDDDCTDSNEATSSEPTGDCDDDSSTTFPGAAPNDSATACMKDDDGDDYGDDSAPSGVTDGDDCDDDDSTISPVGTEITGDEIDQDCNGGEICYLDDDNDGYRPDATSTKTSADEDCSDNDEATSSEPTDDCDDTDSAINPGEAEIVGDEVDQDCSGGETCYVDDDNDGFINIDLDTVESSDDDCTDAGEATSAQDDGDCDDSESTTYPGADEICGDGISDQDCDGDDTECTLSDIGLLNADAKYAGSSSTDYVGDTVLFADLTGDGNLDLLIGAQSMATVYMVAGTSTADTTLSTGADAAFTGASATGYALASAGDVDNDGYEDVIIGAYLASPVSDREGTAYLLYGPVTSDIDLSSAADVIIDGENSGARLGISVAGIGEQGGLGSFDDVLIGTERDSADGLSSNGVAYVLRGGSSLATSQSMPTDADTAIWGAASGDRAGVEVASAGDVDGDGSEDALIGAYYESTNADETGAAYLLYGPLTTDGDVTMGTTFLGTEQDGYAGYALSAAGDVDDDGYDDILIGAYGADEAYLILGSASPLLDADLDSGDVDTVFTGANGERFGVSMALAGDLSGDGIADVLIGADKANGTDGEVYAYFSPISSGTVAHTAADVTIVGENTSRAGTAITGGEDYDGDGINDILIGSNKADSNRGAAYLILGMWE